MMFERKFIWIWYFLEYHSNKVAESRLSARVKELLFTQAIRPTMTYGAALFAGGAKHFNYETPEAAN